MIKTFIAIASILFALLAHSQETEAKNPSVTEPAGKPDSFACKNVKQYAPKMPRKALQDGISGTVRVQVLFTNGEPNQVTILSGPSVFHDAVREHLMGYVCTGLTKPINGTQEFKFTVE